MVVVLTSGEDIDRQVTTTYERRTSICVYNMTQICGFVGNDVHNLYFTQLN